jgi:acyl-CoA dehydrogenase
MPSRCTSPSASARTCRFSTWYRYARSARIADGPDEVHEVVVARDYLRGKLDLLV